MPRQDFRVRTDGIDPQHDLPAFEEPEEELPLFCKNASARQMRSELAMRRSRRAAKSTMATRPQTCSFRREVGLDSECDKRNCALLSYLWLHPRRSDPVIVCANSHI